MAIAFLAGLFLIYHTIILGYVTVYNGGGGVCVLGLRVDPSSCFAARVEPLVPGRLDGAARPAALCVGAPCLETRPAAAGRHHRGDY